MSYAGLVQSQNELLSNLASENLNVEAGNIRVKEEFDKKQKDLTDAITDLQGKESGEIGKTEVVEGIPINEDDIAAVMGGKAGINLVRNVKNLATSGLKNAPTELASTETFGGQLKNASKFAKAGLKQVFKPPVTKPASKPKPDTQDEANEEGTETEAGNTEEPTPNENAANDTTNATETAVENTAENAGETEAGSAARTAANEGEDLVRGAGEAAEGTMASAAGEILGKAGAGLSIASGLELGSKDLTGLVQGKGWDAFGDNTSERVGNILDLAGDVTSIIPGGEIVGGLLDLAGGAFSYFGEKSENDKINEEISNKQKEQDANNQNKPVPQGNIIHPSLSTLGIVSNVSHPVGQMIAGSGAF